MKRLALSLLGGFAITIFYISALVLLWYWTGNAALVRRLSYPVDLPTWFMPDPSSLSLGTQIFLFLLFIICNAVLYSIPIYFLLSRFSKRKRKATRVDLPPDPPLFVQH